jgi:D-tyrosyl-tRNA(Tyr) deacylase
MNGSSLDFLPDVPPGRECGSYRKSGAAGKGKAVKVRAVIQRVREASVAVGGEQVAAIGPGLLVLLGVGREDAEADADYLAEKIVHLRIFEDESGQMNLSALDTRGALLVVSQFTLYGDARRGRRPGYSAAAAPDDAVRLYRYFVERVKASGLEVGEGVFRAMMDVHLVNQGPVTLLLDSARTF